MIESLKADRKERDKQIVAAILKEAEFIRSEILQSSASVRDVLMRTIVFVGVILTIAGGILAFKGQAQGMSLKQLINTNRWLLWVISEIEVIICVTFLRIYVGSMAGIAAAAAYYRDVLQPRLNKVLDTQGSPILNWENWLRERNTSRRGLPGEDIITTPSFIWLLGMIFAWWALRLTHPGEIVFAVSCVAAGFVVVYGIWAILSILQISDRIPRRLPHLMTRLFDADF